MWFEFYSCQMSAWIRYTVDGWLSGKRLVHFTTWLYMKDSFDETTCKNVKCISLYFILLLYIVVTYITFFLELANKTSDREQNKMMNLEGVKQYKMFVSRQIHVLNRWVINNTLLIITLKRGHSSYKGTFSLQKRRDYCSM